MKVLVRVCLMMSKYMFVLACSSTVDEMTSFTSVTTCLLPAFTTCYSAPYLLTYYCCSTVTVHDF